MNGVGGRTIEEAQRNISLQEFASWIQYRNKRGPFNLARRFDRAVAPMAVRQANRYRDTKQRPEPFSIWDFLPYEEEPPITMEQAMEEWA